MGLHHSLLHHSIRNLTSLQRPVAQTKAWKEFGGAYSKVLEHKSPMNVDIHSAGGDQIRARLFSLDSGYWSQGLSCYADRII